MKKVLMWLVLGIFVAGCAATAIGNKKVKTFDSSTIEFGKTTKAEILAKLGEPGSKEFGPNETETWKYLYSEVFVCPIGSNQWAGNYTFVFDKNGVLQKEGSKLAAPPLKKKRGSQEK